ncbi:MAG: PilZ domain-containing protein [Planctomycetes bacterium]|nr:PilZ domain-containing protein [Planctomycetota bacterium]
MKDKIPDDRRVAERLDSGHLVIHTDVGETDLNRTLGLGVTLDINEFGIKVQATSPMPLGERFRFSLALDESIIEATGKVVHVDRALNGTFEIGIEFIEIFGRYIEAIRKFVARRKSERGY